MGFFPLKAIPTTLYREHRLYIPECLNDLYTQQLRNLGLFDATLGGSDERSIFGGESKDATDQHFAHRFPNSVVRVEDILLDPGSVFGAIPEDLLLTLSSHEIAVLDIPCGAGAAGLTLLSLLAALRRAHLIPQHPLNIRLVGGDISPHALCIYRQMFDAYRDSVRSAAILADLATYAWNATDVQKTNQLCDNWFAFAGNQVNEYLVLIANFSGDGTSLIDKIRPVLDHILARISNKKATLLWIEPGGERGRSFLVKVAKKVLSAVPWLHNNYTTGGPIEHEFRWWHGLINRELPGSVAVQQYERL